MGHSREPAPPARVLPEIPLEEKTAMRKTLIALAAALTLPALASIPEPSGVTPRLRAASDEVPAFLSI